MALWFIWAGLIIGISFVEAPLKFQAPNMTTVLGLGIGKLVFTALNRIELGLALIISVMLFLTEKEMRRVVLYAVAVGILFIQTFWFLPILNSRVDLIVAGQDPGPSYYHLAFVAAEVSKLIVLVLGGILYMKPVASFFGKDDFA